MTDTDPCLLKVTIPEEKIRENPEYSICNAIAEINCDYGCPVDTNEFSVKTLSKYGTSSK